MGAGATKQQDRPTEAFARRHFDEIDTDNGNALSITELVCAAKKIAKEVKRKWTDEEINTIFHSLDLNHDGSLDFAEFTAGLDTLIGTISSKAGSSMGRRPIALAAKEKKAEQARMIEEMKRMSAAANASLEAVGHHSSAAMLQHEDEQIKPEELERRKSKQINEKVMADKAAEKESAALKAGADGAAKDARRQMEELRKKREQEAVERDAAEKAAEEAKVKKEAEAKESAEKAAAEAEVAQRMQKKVEMIEAKKASKQIEVQARKQVDADKKTMAEIEKIAKMQALKELRTGGTAQQINEARKLREDAEKQLEEMEEREQEEKDKREFEAAMRQAEKQGRAMEKKLEEAKRAAQAAAENPKASRRVAAVRAERASTSAAFSGASTEGVTTGAPADAVAPNAQSNPSEERAKEPEDAPTCAAIEPSATQSARTPVSETAEAPAHEVAPAPTTGEAKTPGQRSARACVSDAVAHGDTLAEAANQGIAFGA